MENPTLDCTNLVVVGYQQSGRYMLGYPTATPIPYTFKLILNIVDPVHGPKQMYRTVNNNGGEKISEIGEVRKSVSFGEYGAANLIISLHHGQIWDEQGKPIPMYP